MDIHSFPPISNENSQILVLGTMPGKKSLQEKQYYANSRNAFWKIAEDLFGIDHLLSYDLRKKGLLENGIALWDVLKTCTRESSLDSDIVESTMVVNSFPEFFHSHPNIKMIVFNGVKSEKIYTRKVLNTLGLGFIEPRYLRLPSTSPAAAMKYEAKLRAWSVIGNIA